MISSSEGGGPGAEGGGGAGSVVEEWRLVLGRCSRVVGVKSVTGERHGLIAVLRMWEICSRGGNMRGITGDTT